MSDSTRLSKSAGKVFRIIGLSKSAASGIFLATRSIHSENTESLIDEKEREILFNSAALGAASLGFISEPNGRVRLQWLFPIGNEILFHAL